MKKKNIFVKYLVYLIRWQLSTPILSIVLSLLTNIGVLWATIIANFIGGLIFFWVDMFIFNNDKRGKKKMDFNVIADLKLLKEDIQFDLSNIDFDDEEESLSSLNNLIDKVSNNKDKHFKKILDILSNEFDDIITKYKNALEYIKDTLDEEDILLF